MSAQTAVASFLDQTGAMVASYLDACVHCGNCAPACHFYEASGDPRHTPIYKLQPLAKAYRRHKAPFAGFNRMLGLAPAEVTEAELQEWQELIYDTCTMCGRCTLACPMGIDIATHVHVSRRGMVAAGLAPPELMTVVDRSRDEGSPLGVTPEKLKERIEWLREEYDVDIPLDKPKAQVLLTASSIETMKYPEALAAMAKILNHAGEDWTFSTRGYEATNFGLLAGQIEVSETMVCRIVETAEALGAKLVILPECGHAYGALRWSGANIIGRELQFEVLQIAEYLAKLKREGRLQLSPLTESITFHDPCQVARRGGATDAPREVLAGFAQDFREMDHAGNGNWCCGGGGGVSTISRANDLRHKTFEIKMRQVEDTGAGTLVSSCANCRQTFDDDKSFYKWDRNVGSLVELVEDHLVQ
ncbi:MAG: (Fe-S)-binding protein [Gammaproteobacteria bacterium]